MNRAAARFIPFSLVLALAACVAPKSDPQRFGIYSARLDGSDQQLILASETQELTHARASPDGRWITFTRYHRKGLNGLAEESDGYLQTEIVLMRMDGTGLRTVVAPKRGVIAGNSSFTPDGRALIYISTDNRERRPEIRRIDLTSGETRTLPTPPGLKPSDPHQVGEWMVFPAVNDEPHAIWIMRTDGRGARELTRPVIARDGKRWKFRPGDYDPRLSPDGRRVAFMRYVGDDNWHLVVVEVASGHERDLSPAVSVDGLPDWSPDSRRIIFWHADRSDIPAVGLWTVNPDGRGRHQIPLARGFLHRHPNFIPGAGAGGHARILFCARRDPNIH